MPRLCGFYPGICFTTEEKARENLSQGSWRVPVGTMKIHRYTIRTYRHKNKKLRLLFQVCWIRDIWTDLKMSTSIWSPTVKVQTDIKHTSQVTTRTWTTRNTSDDFKIVFMRSLYSHSSIHWYSFISNAKLLLDSKSHYRYYTPKTYRLYFLVHLSISCTRGKVTK